MYREIRLALDESTNEELARIGSDARFDGQIYVNGQPFTREDVEILGGALERIRQENATGAYAFYRPRLESLAARLAALLPPENIDTGDR